MFVKIAREGEDERIEGFSYKNKNGIEEVVLVNNEYLICIKVSNGDWIKIWDEDIPTLIKTLKTAYEYKMKDRK